jgi:hypothetical protein
MFTFQVGVNSSTANGQTNLMFYKNGSSLLLSAVIVPTGYNERPAIVVERCVVGDTMVFNFSTTQVSLTLRSAETSLSIGYLHP